MIHRRPDTDRVLASIDAAVDNRCACGCGTRLNPRGASMWFATEVCQSRWKRRRATNPDEVLGSIPSTEGRYTPTPVLSPLEAAAVAQRFLDGESPPEPREMAAAEVVDRFACDPAHQVVLVACAHLQPAWHPGNGDEGEFGAGDGPRMLPQWRYRVQADRMRPVWTCTCCCAWQSRAFRFQP